MCETVTRTAGRTHHAATPCGGEQRRTAAAQDERHAAPRGGGCYLEACGGAMERNGLGGGDTRTQCSGSMGTNRAGRAGGRGEQRAFKSPEVGSTGQPAKLCRRYAPPLTGAMTAMRAMSDLARRREARRTRRQGLRSCARGHNRRHRRTSDMLLRQASTSRFGAMDACDCLPVKGRGLGPAACAVHASAQRSQKDGSSWRNARRYSYRLLPLLKRWQLRRLQ